MTHDKYVSMFMEKMSQAGVKPMSGAIQSSNQLTGQHERCSILRDVPVAFSNNSQFLQLIASSNSK